MKTLTIVLLILLSFSCKKEEIYTSAELISKDLTDITNEKSIQHASVYTIEHYNGTPYLTEAAYKKKFSFKGAFIIIDDVYYNLEKLDRFEIIEDDNPSYIALYFLN